MAAFQVAILALLWAFLQSYHVGGSGGCPYTKPASHCGSRPNSISQGFPSDRICKLAMSTGQIEFITSVEANVDIELYDLSTGQIAHCFKATSFDRCVGISYSVWGAKPYIAVCSSQSVTSFAGTVSYGLSDWSSFVISSDNPGSKVGHQFNFFIHENFHVFSHRAAGAGPNKLTIRFLEPYEPQKVLQSPPNSNDPNYRYHYSNAQEVEVWRIKNKGNSLVSLQCERECTVQLLSESDLASSGWTLSPGSLADGENGAEYGTEHVFWANQRITIWSFEDSNNVEITDLFHPDQIDSVQNSGLDSLTFTIHSKVVWSNGALNPLVAPSVFSIHASSPGDFDNQYVHIRSSKPVLVMVGSATPSDRKGTSLDALASIKIGTDYVACIWANRDGFRLLTYHSDNEIQGETLTGQTYFSFSVGSGGWSGVGAFFWEPSHSFDGELLYLIGTKPYVVFYGDFDGSIKECCLGTFLPETSPSFLAPPLADAGNDVQICEGSVTTLDGSESIDQDSEGSGNSISSYTWQVGSASGPVISISATVAVSPDLGSHTYFLTVEDNDGETDTASVVVEVIDCCLSDPLLMTTSVDSPSCFGSQNGRINLVVSGGAAPLFFGLRQWINSSSELLPSVAPPFDGLGGGFYEVLVEDSNGCAIRKNVTVGQPESLGVASERIQGPSCAGSSDASMVIGIEGGTGPHMVGLRKVVGQVPNTLTNEANSATLPQILQASSGVPESSTPGVGEGAQGLGALGEHGVWALLLEDSSAGSWSMAQLPSGQYEVVSRDSQGCVSSSAITIPSTSGISIDFPAELQSPVLCSGGSGSIEAVVSGGTPISVSDDDDGGGGFGYILSWSGVLSDGNSVSPSANSTKLQGLGAGTYTLTAEDSNGCSVAQSYKLEEPSPLRLTFSRVVNCTCNGSSDGVLEVEAEGGIQPVNFTWYLVASDSELVLIDSQDTATSSMASDLSSAKYRVVAMDGNGCEVIEEAELWAPERLIVSISMTKAAGCFGSADGTAMVSVSGGNGGYSVGVLKGVLGAGAPLSDQMTSTSLVEQLEAFSGVSESSTPGVGEGAQGLGALGEHGVWALLLEDSSAGSWSMAQLPSGQYEVVSRDSQGCVSSSAITIPSTSGISIDFPAELQSPVLCSGGSGSIEAVVSGGTPISVSDDDDGVGGFGYILSWSGVLSDGNSVSPSANSTQLQGLGAGTYTLTAEDSNGCSVAQSYKLEEPSPLRLTFSRVVNCTCNGSSDGVLEVEAEGGIQPVNFTWYLVASDSELVLIDSQDTATSSMASDLSSAKYRVVAMDGNGCEVIEEAELWAPERLIVSISMTKAAGCFGSADGSAMVGVSGGNGGYSVGVLKGVLGAGTPLSDQMTSTSLVEQLEAFSGVSESSTPGVGEGAQGLGALGEHGVWALLLEDSSAGSWSMAQLPSGQYEVVSRDSQGCVSSSAITIPSTSGISIDFPAELQSPVLCSGGSGSIEAVVSGGTPISVSDDDDGVGGFGYILSWSGVLSDGNSVSPSANSTQLQGLGAGTYTLTAEDSNGCSVAQSYKLEEPSPLRLTFSRVVNCTCNGSSDGVLEVEAEGGIQPVNFTWYLVASDSELVLIDSQDTATSSMASDLSSAKYRVVAMDGNGCEVIEEAELWAPERLIVSISMTKAAGCFGSADGSAMVGVSGGNGGYSVGVLKGVLGAGTPLSDQMTSTSLVEQLEALSGVSESSTPGVGEGAQGLGALGEHGVWALLLEDSSAGSWSMAQLPSGQYEVVSRDSQGCVSSSAITIPSTSGISIDFPAELQSPVLCSGGSGSIEAVVSGGTPISVSDVDDGGGGFGYILSWSGVLSDGNSVSPSANSTKLQGLGAGTYTLTAEDSNGCSVAQSYKLEEPSPLRLAFSRVVNCTCNGSSDGVLEVEAEGGIQPVNFTWYLVASDSELVLIDSQDTATSSMASDLSSAKYRVVAMDGNGCEVIEEAELWAPERLIVSISMTKAAGCFGSADGTAMVSVSGGNGGYSVGVLKGVLGAGTPLSDQMTSTSLVEQLEALSGVSESSTPGVGEGSQGLGALGEHGVWAILGDDLIAANLSARTYTALVSDSSSCMASLPFVVESSSDFTVAVLPSPTTPEWASLLEEGNVAEASLCSLAEESLIPTEGWCSEKYLPLHPPQFPAEVCGEATQQGLWPKAMCPPRCTRGSAVGFSLDVAGGSPPYEYSWSYEGQYSSWWRDNYPMNGTIGAPRAGLYSVTVADSMNCHLRRSVHVPEPQELSLEIEEIIPPRCGQDVTGQIIVRTKGGIPPYWLKVECGIDCDCSSCDTEPLRAMTSETFTVTDLCSCNYNLSLSDRLGCTYSGELVVAVPTVKPLAAWYSSNTGGLAIAGGIRPRLVELVSDKGERHVLWDDHNTSVASQYPHAPQEHGNVSMTEDILYLFGDTEESEEILFSLPGHWQGEVTDAVGCSEHFQFRIPDKISQPTPDSSGFRIGSSSEGFIVRDSSGCAAPTWGEWTEWSGCVWSCSLGKFAGFDDSQLRSPRGSVWREAGKLTEGPQPTSSEVVSAIWKASLGSAVVKQAVACETDPGSEEPAITPGTSKSAGIGHAVSWRLRYPVPITASVLEKEVTLINGTLLSLPAVPFDNTVSYVNWSAAWYVSDEGTILSGRLNTNCWTHAQLEWRPCTTAAMQGKTASYYDAECSAGEKWSTTSQLSSSLGLLLGYVGGLLAVGFVLGSHLFVFFRLRSWSKAELGNELPGVWFLTFGTGFLGSNVLDLWYYLSFVWSLSHSTLCLIPPPYKQFTAVFSLAALLPPLPGFFSYHGLEWARGCEPLVPASAFLGLAPTDVGLVSVIIVFCAGAIMSATGLVFYFIARRRGRWSNEQKDTTRQTQSWLPFIPSVCMGMIPRLCLLLLHPALITAVVIANHAVTIGVIPSFQLSACIAGVILGISTIGLLVKCNRSNKNGRAQAEGKVLSEQSRLVPTHREVVFAAWKPGGRQGCTAFPLCLKVVPGVITAISFGSLTGAGIVALIPPLVAFLALFLIILFLKPFQSKVTACFEIGILSSCILSLVLMLPFSLEAGGALGSGQRNGIAWLCMSIHILTIFSFAVFPCFSLRRLKRGALPLHQTRPSGPNSDTASSNAIVSAVQGHAHEQPLGLNPLFRHVEPTPAEELGVVAQSSIDSKNVHSALEFDGKKNTVQPSSENGIGGNTCGHKGLTADMVSREEQAHMEYKEKGGTELVPSGRGQSAWHQQSKFFDSEDSVVTVSPLFSLQLDTPHALSFAQQCVQQGTAGGEAYSIQWYGDDEAVLEREDRQVQHMLDETNRDETVAQYAEGTQGTPPAKTTKRIHRNRNHRWRLVRHIPGLRRKSLHYSSQSKFMQTIEAYEHRIKQEMVQDGVDERVNPHKVVKELPVGKKLFNQMKSLKCIHAADNTGDVKDGNSSV